MHFLDVDEGAIRENFWFFKAMPEKTTEEEIFHIASQYLTLKEELGGKTELTKWKHTFTDGATAMVGRTKGFVSRVKEINPDLIFTQCFLQCEALVAKTLPVDLVQGSQLKLLRGPNEDL